MIANARYLRRRWPLTARQTGWVAVLIIYGVGIAGLASPWRPLFLALTPFNLMASALALLLTHPRFTQREAGYFGFVVAAGIGIEILGVYTGAIFGIYAYGPVFGVQLLGVPLLIGLNWLVLAYCAGAVAERWLKGDTRINKILRALLAATLMAGLDALIEPVAIALGFWHWHGAQPPLQNYAGWWVFSAALQALGQALGIRFGAWLAMPLAVAQVVFFVALNLLA